MTSLKVVDGILELMKWKKKYSLNIRLVFEKWTRTLEERKVTRHSSHEPRCSNSKKIISKLNQAKYIFKIHYNHIGVIPEMQ